MGATHPRPGLPSPRGGPANTLTIKTVCIAAYLLHHLPGTAPFGINMGETPNRRLFRYQNGRECELGVVSAVQVARPRLEQRAEFPNEFYFTENRDDMLTL